MLGQRDRPFRAPSANLLFESVAGAYGDSTIAVVLTGTGVDGAMGVKAVKSKGGTVIVEDPATAQFRGVPEAARRTRSVDFVVQLTEVRLTAVERRLGPSDLQYLDVHVHPLVRPDGVILGVDVSFVDVSTLVRVQDEARRAGQDLETSYEELQSTNEELETTNEELQSSIEELETTNEELQSSNEELETMNDELRSRSIELDETARYVEAVLESIGDGIIVLDAGLRIRNWNPRAEDLWGLRASEVVGELFFTLDFGLPTAELREPMRSCLDTRNRERVEIEAVNRLGRTLHCLVTITCLGGDLGGVVLCMEDRESV